LESVFALVLKRTLFDNFVRLGKVFIKIFDRNFKKLRFFFNSFQILELLHHFFSVLVNLGLDGIDIFDLLYPFVVMLLPVPHSLLHILTFFLDLMALQDIIKVRRSNNQLFFAANILPVRFPFLVAHMLKVFAFEFVVLH
jgi:hypothetical protein